MNERKKRHVAMTDEQHRKLKVLAASKGLFLGDCINGLVEFVESAKFVNDSDFKKQFNNLLELAFLNTGEDLGGFGAGVSGVEIKENGKADLSKLQEKIRNG